MKYIIKFKPAADRALFSIPERTKQRILSKICSLASDPRPRAAKKMKGPEGYYSIRVSEYRIVYDVQDDRLVILVVRIGHRRDSYRRL